MRESVEGEAWEGGEGGRGVDEREGRGGWKEVERTGGGGRRAEEVVP